MTKLTMDQSIWKSLPPGPVTSFVDQDDGINLRRAGRFLVDSKWTIIGFAIVFAFVGFAYAVLSHPVYEATFVVQVNDNPRLDAHMLGNTAAPPEARMESSSQVELLRSRMVLSAAVDATRFNIEARPKYFPLIGEWIARRNPDLSDPGLFGYGGYAWGGEQIDVRRLEMPAGFEGETIVLTADGDNHFHFALGNDGMMIRGETGKLIRVPLGDGVLEIMVARLRSRPGAQFELIRASRLGTVQELQKDLKIAEQGKQSGVIKVTLAGTDRYRITGLLKKIAEQYLHQNEEQRTLATERILASLETQLPRLKQELERSEARYNEARNRSKTLNLSEEGSALLQQSVLVQIKVLELNQRKAELAARYTEDHPSVQTLRRQIDILNAQAGTIAAKIKKLPEIEQVILPLSRDVQVNTGVYTAAMSTAQQLRLTASTQSGNVRMVDPPELPVKPIGMGNAVKALAMGMFGLVFGAVFSLLRKAVSKRVHDPQEIENTLGVPIVAAIPHSEHQKTLKPRSLKTTTSLPLLPQSGCLDSAVEGLRRFRVCLESAMQGSVNNVMVITGPAPGVGKTFLAANFAAVLASIGKKVLLIDTDMRTGHLHRFFGADGSRGLSEALSSDSPWEQLVQKDLVANVDIIASGENPGMPAELLTGRRFVELLGAVSPYYDYVLIDTAPVLVVSDALIAARHAGITFNVVRGGITTLDQIEQTIKEFVQAGLSVPATVFNDSGPRHCKYGYQFRYGTALAPSGSRPDAA